MKDNLSKTIKIILEKLPLGSAVINVIRKKRNSNFYNSFKSNEELFTHYFVNNQWGNKESVSGDGSTELYTENIRRALPPLFEELKVKAILDAPCGDYNWFKLIPRPAAVQYIGGDIVRELVLQNEKHFGNANTKFIHLDITKDKLPEADIWICRDCLFHLSNEDIWKAINNFLESDIKYLLTTVHCENERNEDTKTGSFRFLNLELEPFNFCPPILAIDDWIEGFPVRKLALWNREIIMSSLRGKKI